VIADAYAVFAGRAAAAKTPGTKQQRIREHILRHAPITFCLADIRTAVPGVSDQTIRPCWPVDAPLRRLVDK
jgi:hypothetical protein